MCFNPKVAKLADVAAKDISKEFARCAKNAAKYTRFFIP